MTADIIGQRFGKLVVVEQVPKPESRRTKGAYYRCKCDCGGETIVARRLLVGKRTRSCGCVRTQHLNSVRHTGGGVRGARRKTRPWNFDDLTGKRFGWLTVILYVGRHNNETLWLCRCDCGKECVVDRKPLVGGKTSSCGCMPPKDRPRYRKQNREAHKREIVDKYHGE